MDRELKALRESFWELEEVGLVLEERAIRVQDRTPHMDRILNGIIGRMADQLTALEERCAGVVGGH